MLAIILQHVRELAEAHFPPAERDRFKLITPFPPTGGDFPDFLQDDLVFGDPPADTASAIEDTQHGYDFFTRTDGMYYDLSYGTRSEYRLSRICEDFYLKAQPKPDDPAFDAWFSEKQDAFRLYSRNVVGTLSRDPFKYTSLTAMAWNADKIVLDASEVARLREKAILLYEDLDPEGSDFIQKLIEDLRAADYERVEYEFGYFDVIREWVDARLFEHTGWAFPDGKRALYGDQDPSFAPNSDLQLCFAQRFYLVRNHLATPKAGVPVLTPMLRDHRVETVGPPMLGTPVSATGSPGGVLVSEPASVHDHRNADSVAAVASRRTLRNSLIRRRIEAAAIDAASLDAGQVTTIDSALAQPTPAPRAGYVWIGAHGDVAGRWERERAGAAPPPPAEPSPPASYKVAAVKCRVISPMP